MRELGCLVQEDVLDDQAFQCRQRGRDVLCIRIGLREIFTLDVHAPETAIERRLEHVRNAQTGFGFESDAPG